MDEQIDAIYEWIADLEGSRESADDAKRVVIDLRISELRRALARLMGEEEDRP